MTLDKALDFLRAYPKPVTIMEVCGSHTSVIVKSGIRQLLSPRIRLVSGPGCPVCVTSAAVVDTLVSCAKKENHTVLCFGDLFRVPGSGGSLAEAKAGGPRGQGRVELIYSPLEALGFARRHPEITYVVAAVGFETTAPVYAVLLDDMIRTGIGNIRLVTALKTMPQVMDYICAGEGIDGFICPGHVSVVTGLAPFETLCAKYHKPFVIAGFEPEHILAAIYEIARQIDAGAPRAVNLYKGAVTGRPQAAALALINRYFMAADAVWRGIGTVAGSGLVLRSDYARFGIPVAETDSAEDNGCRCRDVMLGRILPCDCPLFGGACTPDSPAGACMVSAEGSCGIAYTQGE